MILLRARRDIGEGDGDFDNADGALITVHLKVSSRLIAIVEYLLSDSRILTSW